MGYDSSKKSRVRSKRRKLAKARAAKKAESLAKKKG